MKINGISIQGMFLYSPEMEYERNDFIIEGTTIYVCSPVESDSVVGESPAESKNFYVYLGNKSATLQDYINFLDNENGGDDKYVPLDILPSILNHYMVGLTGKGVIGSWIRYDEKKQVIETSDSSLSTDNPDNILSNILDDDNINYSIYRVSSNIPELRSLVTETDSGNAATTDFILKQYTYYSDNNERVRVQELIDHSTGQIYYRSNLWQVWKCATPSNYKILKDRMDNLYSLYAAKLNSLELVKSSLTNNFRFCSIPIKKGSDSGVSSITLSNNPLDDSYNESVVYLSEVSDITRLDNVTVRVICTTGGVIRSSEFSFDPLDFISDPTATSSVNYYINSSVVASVTFTPYSTGTGRIKISLIGSSYVISNVYYKKYFNS